MRYVEMPGSKADGKALSEVMLRSDIYITHHLTVNSHNEPQSPSEFKMSGVEVLAGARPRL